ncbi:MAG: hypothetical protein JWL59_3532 [Chthoniobacteraceae bacterium]|nr:hypothetical protein [Chthoniobacteraceae bacterium]
MISLGAANRVFLACGVTDMRKGYAGLYGLVKLLIVVSGDSAAGDNPAIHSESRKSRSKRGASHIIEIEVDPVRCLALQLFSDRADIVIDGDIELALVLQKKAFSIEPAAPMTRQLRNFASCPATFPTAPAI